ncbi:MAG: SEC-C domain-containing protein [Gemmatimonadaceae bacterium]|nr:SEC-C domain-containing protein [Gemmatimonadaceae bacterium]
MFKSMKEQGTDLILRLQVSEEVEKQEHASVWNEEQAQTIHEDAKSAFDGGGGAEMAAQSEHGGSDLKAVETIRRTERSARPNDPCPCGSGKKYKKCCGRMGGGPDDGPAEIKTGGPPGKDHKGHVRLGG